MSRTFDAGILGRLGEATSEELAAALSAIRTDFSHFASQPASQDNLSAVTELESAAQSIKAEQASRAQQAADYSARLSSLGALTDKSDDKPAEPDPQVQQEPLEPGQPDKRAEPNQPALPEPGEGDGDKPSGDGDDSAVTAAGAPRRPLGTGGHKPAARRAAAIPRVTVQTYANHGVAHSPAGEPVAMSDVLRAFEDRRRLNRAGGGGYERYPIVTAVTTFPEDRFLARQADPDRNDNVVRRAVREAASIHARDNLNRELRIRTGRSEDSALVAAGLCAPVETIYDIDVVGDQDRPIRDSAVVRFGAERGGVQLRPDISGAGQTLATGVWTTTQDEADPIVPKTCVEIDCPGLVTAEVEALYQCMTWSNMSTRFDPEGMQANLEAQGVAHARFAENRLFTQIQTASKDVYSSRVLGATRDILVTLDQMTAYLRNRHRLRGAMPLRWVAPLWARNLMRADITRQMVGDGLQSLAVTDAELERWLAERNVNTTWHLDGTDPADITGPTPDVVVPAQFYANLVDESAVPGFPDAISTLLYPEGTWLYLDGGTLDLGVVRDSTLNSQNRFQTFSEEFAFPLFKGVESIHLVMQVQPTGQSAATRDTNAIVD